MLKQSKTKEQEGKNKELRGLEYEVQILRGEKEKQKEIALMREKELLQREVDMIKKMDKTNQRLQDALDALKHKTDKPRMSLELSQGADVDFSAYIATDERLTRENYQRSLPRMSAAERRPFLSPSGLSSFLSVCLGSSTSYQQGSDHELRRLLDTSGEEIRDEVSTRRTLSRDKDQERRSASISRDVLESRSECCSKETQKLSGKKQYQEEYDDERISPFNRRKSSTSGHTERKQYLKEYDDPRTSPPKRRKSVLKSATPDSDNSSGDEHERRPKKESRTIRFSDQMSESGNEFKREQSTPKKKYRKRRCETVCDTEESDVEVTPTKRGYMKLSPYNGTTSLEVFLSQFDNCCQYNKWRAYERLAQLKGALTGNAAQILLGDQGEKLDYSDLREELQKCFGAGRTSNTISYATEVKTTTTK